MNRYTNMAVSLKHFNIINIPIRAFEYKLECPFERQYILRCKIKDIHKDYSIPEELQWIKNFVEQCQAFQDAHNIRQPYCYITVRHGIVDSITDDEWHTDGYSEVITHLPEQNYIITTNNCTEYVKLPIQFPKDFDPLKHNVHSFIQDEIKRWKPTIHTADANVCYVFDPYCIHRRPIEATGKMRTFVRVTFTPIEICDDNCYLSNGVYNRTSDTTRSKLIKY